MHSFEQTQLKYFLILQIALVLDINAPQVDSSRFALMLLDILK